MLLTLSVIWQCHTQKVPPLNCWAFALLWVVKLDFQPVILICTFASFDLCLLIYNATAAVFQV